MRRSNAWLPQERLRLAQVARIVGHTNLNQIMTYDNGGGEDLAAKLDGKE